MALTDFYISFLVDEGYVNLRAEELKLACLCVDYLNLPAFMDPPPGKGALNGDYRFMDYALKYWLQHLEAGAALETHTHDQLVSQLGRIFGNVHQPISESPQRDVQVSQTSQ